MATLKLTKSAIDAAKSGAKAIELRDTLVPGFMCKITPAGRRVFMLQYRTNAGQRRKPSLGLYGELTVDQARSLAQHWLAEVRRGNDPGAARAATRAAPTVRELCERFMHEYCVKRLKPTTLRGYQASIRRVIVPMFGRMKVADVRRADIVAMMKQLGSTPCEGNRAFSVMRKMFNLAEVWELRPDGSNPCRHVPMFPPGTETRLITDAELVRLYKHLDKLEAEGVMPFVYPMAVRLQFEFAARRGEICSMEWSWVDLENRRVTWPDSKTGPISKPMSAEAFRLLSMAPRKTGQRHVFPSTTDPSKPVTGGMYFHYWEKILKQAGIPHVGTHGVRHRAATDIANSGVPTKVGMALTAHKTVTVFMRYVHTEERPVRDAAELVAARRQALVYPIGRRGRHEP